MQRIAGHKWFFVIEFIAITSAVMLWNIFPRLTWQPLFIAITPLFIRIANKNPVLVSKPFTYPIAIFLITAVIGVYVSYQPANAWIKFCLIFSSVLYYYLLARQPVNVLRGISVILCLMGFGIGILFLLSNNWEIQPQKFQLLSLIGIEWMRIRPDFSLNAIHPNDIAGIADLTLPFSIALVFENYRRKSLLGTISFSVIVLLVLTAILLTASRGSWMAIITTAGLWILWIMIGWFTRKRKSLRRIIFIIALVLLVCSTLGYLLFAIRGKFSEITIGRPDTSIAEQRFHVFWSTIELIKEVPFSGAGLDSFPGLYSHYILINPNYILSYGHNIFMDAALQQGILGGLVLFIIYMGSILWLIIKPVPPGYAILRVAIVSSLMIIIIHGLVDNIVYRTFYTPLLFVVIGMAAGLMTTNKPIRAEKRLDEPQLPRLAFPIVITFILLIIGLIAFRRPLLSAWFTNLGAVEMAKVELSDFPTGYWDNGQNVDLLFPAESLFHQALAYEPSNPRANYRLGLIAMLQRDFPAAISYLEIAHHGDPYHRGVLKALGLSYVWNGQLESALPLLSLLPETDQELNIYPWWWRELGRPDLAAYAEQYLSLLESGHR